MRSSQILNAELTSAAIGTILGKAPYWVHNLEKQGVVRGNRQDSPHKGELGRNNMPPSCGR